MSAIHTIPLHIGDLITDTMHLSAAELGAYVRLLSAHYRFGVDGLPDDDAQLRRITGLDNKTWRASRETILSLFDLSEDRRYVHGRVQKVLFRIAQVAEQNRDKALKRWESDNATALQQQCSGNATAMQSIIHQSKNLDFKKSPLPPSERQEDDFFENEVLMDLGFDVLHHITDRGLEAAKRSAPGWDVYKLAGDFNNGVRQGKMSKPDHPDKAFPAWCKKITGGRRPA